MKTPAPTDRASAPRGVKPLTLAMIVVAALLIIGGTASGGVAGLILMAALVGVVTSVYALATGRGSWARLASRRVAAITLASCMIVTVVSASFVASSRADEADVVAAIPAVESPSPTPTPTSAPDASVAFTDESPVDPATATEPSEAPAVAVLDKSVTDTTALALLATLPVKGKAPKTGYARTAVFGTAWLDVDRNGCDTRNDILARDLTAVVRSGPCKVLSGSFAEPYTGKIVDFVRGNDTSTLVQIDHVVSLSNAWQTGAQQLSQAQRISLANDPLNLLAADGRANAQKGDGDAATWLPAAKAFRCTYVSRQVSVKATYGLWVAPAEHDAMARVLSACPDERAVTSAFAPPPAPVVAAPVPAPVIVPEPAPAPPAPAPAPAAPAPAAPAPVAPAPAPGVVHPGAFCAPSGATGVTSKGTAMVCGTTPNSPDRARWHQQ
ncbi:HNH endonuclease family protein [Glaciibacter sp. 2TAF33]|uniref:HNH endonuclease family protein n=1 Tax=Glaciibacter sp. 2TAF33 TaxID=3233015 RepID=UPI003F8F9A1B